MAERIEIKVDNRDKVKAELEAAITRALTICGEMAVGYAQENLTSQGAVDTGNLRNSIKKIVHEKEVQVGTNEEYAIYVEIGTGKYASGGRQEPWVYQDDRGNWHRTEGMKARPYLKPAAEQHVDEYRNVFKTELSS